MSKQGQYNQKGINAQNWAAMSLFLQYLYDPNFSYLQLEPDNSEDFDLHFKDGKRIICESKFRNRNFNYKDLNELLQKIIDRKSLRKFDNIIIICKKVSINLLSEIKKTLYFNKKMNIHMKNTDEMYKTLKKHGLTNQMINTLPSLDFWILTNFNQESNYELIAELINGWLPFEEIKRFTDSILQNEIIKKSESGKIFSRNDFENLILNFKNEVKERSDYFNTRHSIKEQFNNLEYIIQNNTFDEIGTSSLTNIALTDDLYLFALDELRKKSDLDLAKWNNLWKLKKRGYYISLVLNIFKNNLRQSSNKHYTLDFCKNRSKDNRSYYHVDHISTDIIQIIIKIMNAANGTNYLNDAFLIIKNLIINQEDKPFYLKNNYSIQGRWEKEQLSKLLQMIYHQTEKPLKNSICDFIFSNFNIINDAEDSYFESPKEIYQILLEWINDDFLNRFNKFVTEITGQYDNFYKKYTKNTKFVGWELLGPSVASFLGDYHIYDFNFNRLILTPAIKNFYVNNKKEGWKYINTRCITETKLVSKKRPDFLNRAVYGIILDRYANQDDKISAESFKILSEFILSKKGIPNKSDLIYSVLYYRDIDYPTSSNEKIWKLLELSIKKYELPTSALLEIMVSELAKQNNQKAIAQLKQWYNNPKYYENFRLDDNYIENIRIHIETNINLAIELFKSFIKSGYVKSVNKTSLSAISAASLLRDIFKKNYQNGLELLRLLESEKVLSIYQQYIYTGCLFNMQGGPGSDDYELLIKLYNDVIDPFLNKYNNALEKRIPIAECREYIIIFAGRLAANKQISYALKIIRAFMHDSNPSTEPRKIENGKYPNTIETVRGRCAWELMNCAVLDGREYIPEIIELTDILANDSIYYVIHMACSALSQLAKNRLSVIPSNRNELFFNADIQIALTLSKKVEKLAFDLLDKFINWPYKVQKAIGISILQVFDHILALNESDTIRLVTVFTDHKLPTELRAEFAPLLIYFAEIRKNAFKNWKFIRASLYDDLSPDQYNHTLFKYKLYDTIKDLQSVDPKHCFKFAANFECIARNGITHTGINLKSDKLVLKYYNILSEKYDKGIYNLIYDTISNKLNETNNKMINTWLDLLTRCLVIEKQFYETEKQAGNIEDVRWHVSLNLSNLICLVYEIAHMDQFKDICALYFSFPTEVMLNESDELVSLLKQLAKDKNNAKYWAIQMIDKLFMRNSLKYRQLKKDVNG